MGLLELRFASFLHDIGKFIQRQGTGGNHQDKGAEFVRSLFGEGATISEIIRMHHSPNDLDDSELKKLAEIVQKADHLSAAERVDDERGKNDPHTSALISPFGYVTGINVSLDSPIVTYFPLTIMSPEIDITPVKTEKEANASSETYGQLYRQFLDNLKELPAQLSESYFETLFYHVCAFTSLVPSATYYSVPDISLFEHLRCTCAIAEALYRGESDSFIIIGGDVSGIQKFIYNVKSPLEAQAGMATRLRGRSLRVEFLAKAAANFILNELSLSIASLIWCTGGHFLILAPSGKEIMEKLKEIQKEVDKRLLKNYHASLYLTLGWIEIPHDGLRSFHKTMQKLSLELERSKRRKFFSIMRSLREEDLPAGKPCSVCGEPIPRGEDRLCTKCDHDEKIGRLLPKSNYIIEILYYDGLEFTGSEFREKESLTDMGTTWFLCKDEDDVGETISRLSKHSEKFKVIRILKVNDAQFLTESIATIAKRPSMPISCGYILIGKYAPMKHGKVMTFDEVALKPEELQDGTERRLAVARMDVDNLGSIFSEGIIGGPEEESEDSELDRISRMNRDTISRYTTMSRLFDHFFKGFVNKILEGKKVFTIYAGGDDVFIAGLWVDVIEACRELNERFRRFTSCNPNITISCGISIFKPKFPVGKAGLEAGELLDGRSKSVTGKNSITVLGETVLWNEETSTRVYRSLDNLLKVAGELEGLLKEKRISTGFLYRLIEFQKHTFEKRDDEYAERMLNTTEPLIRCKYVPFLKYLLARNKSTLGDEWFKKLDEELPKIIPFATLPVSWVLFRYREVWNGEDRDGKGKK